VSTISETRTKHGLNKGQMEMRRWDRLRHKTNKETLNSGKTDKTVNVPDSCIKGVMNWLFTFFILLSEVNL